MFVDFNIVYLQLHFHLLEMKFNPHCILLQLCLLLWISVSPLNWIEQIFSFVASKWSHWSLPMDWSLILKIQIFLPFQVILGTTISSLEFISCNHYNNLVKSLIYSSVSASMSAHFVQAGTTAKRWCKLEKVFAGTHVMDLRHQLQTFKKRDFSIEDYVLKIKMIAFHLVVV